MKQVIRHFEQYGDLPLMVEANFSPEALIKLTEYGWKTLLNCSDMIVKCVLAQEILPCTELFFHVRTENGFCCEFNMIPGTILRKNM